MLRATLTIGGGIVELARLVDGSIDISGNGEVDRLLLRKRNWHKINLGTGGESCVDRSTVVPSGKMTRVVDGVAGSYALVANGYSLR